MSFFRAMLRGCGCGCGRVSVSSIRKKEKEMRREEREKERKVRQHLPVRLAGLGLPQTAEQRVHTHFGSVVAVLLHASILVIVYS